MGGFASLLGGLGQPAQQYGHEIRGILEQRRAHFADFLSKAAAEENDPKTRAELLKHVTDLHSNVDIGKIAPKVIKTIQNKDQSDQALAQLMGGPPQQPKPQPGPAQPGSTPGTPQLAPGSAAQPATSPVAPQAQTESQPQISPITDYSPINPPQPALEIPPVQAQAQQPVQPSAPTAQPSGLPDLNIQDPMAVMHKYMGHPMWGAPANRPALQAAMTQELSHNEALRQTVEQSQAALQIGLHKLGMISDPRVKAAAAQLKAQGVPEFLIPTMIGSALGIQMPTMTGMMSAMFTPIRMTGQSPESVIQRWPDEAREAGIHPGSGPVDVFLNKITDKPISIGGHAIRNALTPGVDAQGNPTMMMVNPYGAPGQVATINGVSATPASQITPIKEPTAGGGVELTSAAGVRSGAPPTMIPGAVSPPMLPSTTQSLRSIQTNDANGNPITRLEPVSATRTRGAATGVPPVSGNSTAPHAPGPGPKEFEKPFTPEQMVRHEQQLGQYKIAVDRMSQIQKDLPLLNSLLNSGKLNLELDSSGLIKALINRAMPMTESEERFIGNFRTMMEDINLLRGPMGATGFRGPEAWAALQAQRGQLLARPGITKQVLANSIQALKAQLKPLERFDKDKPKEGESKGMTITLPSGKKVVIE